MCYCDSNTKISDRPTDCVQTNFRRRSYQYIGIVMINVATQFPKLLCKHKESAHLWLLLSRLATNEKDLKPSKHESASVN